MGLAKMAKSAEQKEVRKEVNEPIKEEAHSSI